LAVFIGHELAGLIPQQIVLITAAGLFLFFGYQSWREAKNIKAPNLSARFGRSGLIVSFSVIFITELGERTQLAMIAVLAGTGDISALFLGGTLALWSISRLGILFGRTVLRKLPHQLVRQAAALLFLAFAALALVYVIQSWHLARPCIRPLRV
jgi:putative Ca2+/H+ antiporter (TMEM165/GDT1 family)